MCAQQGVSVGVSPPCTVPLPRHIVLSFRDVTGESSNPRASIIRSTARINGAQWGAVFRLGT